MPRPQLAAGTFSAGFLRELHRAAERREGRMRQLGNRTVDSVLDEDVDETDFFEY